MTKAIIFNIMRYCIHDGPGIRTTVFFKGCPLSCKWCHNPEGIENKPQKSFNPSKCINCGRCSAEEDCPTGAKEIIGYEITFDELMNEINKDALFYEQSKGGVTFSGGEPFYQAEFLLETLSLCKKNYIKTAVDTCGFCDTETLLKAAQITDLFLYDLKFMDTEKHMQFCGKPNDLILANLKFLSETKIKIQLRVPVFPLINDSVYEMTAVFEYIKNMPNIETVHLLPYHNIQSDKYKRLGKNYELSEIPSGESPNMNVIKEIFNRKFSVKVGG